MPPNKVTRKLSDVLNNGGNGFGDRWASTQAAGDDAPIPRGDYVCHVVAGELSKSKSKGTPGYKLTFRIIEGDHKGRLLWHDLWLTENAIELTKRDAAKLGISSPEQFEQPLPPGFRCKVCVVLHKDDDGVQHNKVKRFEVLGVDELPPNPYIDEEPDPDQEIPV